MTRAKLRRSFVPVIAIAIVASVAGLYFGYRAVVRERHRAQCQNNLKRLVLAMHDYADKHAGRIPPAYVLGKDGKPWHSWRVLILPYLGRQDLYDAYRFDEPWDGPSNSKLIAQMPEIYGCPADDNHRPGMTNYLAITGSQTAFPGDRAPTLSELTAADGTAFTVFLIETIDSDVAWTEPRDIKMQELFADEDHLSPKFASKHGEFVQLGFGDGSVRNTRPNGVQSGHNRQIFYGYMTAWSGQPYKGRSLPGEMEFAIGAFPPEVDAEKLTSTDVVAHLHGPSAPQRNAIWCATAQIAWDELRQQIGAAPDVKDSEVAAGLNKAPFAHAALDPAAYVARMDSVGQGVKQKIAEEMREKFPGVTPSEISTGQSTDVILYGFLRKNLPFEVKFDVLREPLTFHAADGHIQVKSFGFAKLKDARSSIETLTKQVAVLNYVSDDDFVIRLNSRSDQIILAKVPGAVTLSDTIAAVQRRITAGEARRPSVEDEDTLMVPHLAFNVLRKYRELDDKKILNLKRDGFPFFVIREAQQSVRFLLNESGARI